jgi:hypothetical protein
MNDIHGDRIRPDELELEDRLRAERPQLTPIELDALKRRVGGRIAREGAGPLARKDAILKSRLAITLMLVLGLVFSTSGAGLAISGISDDGSAGTAQYRQPGEELGQQDEGQAPEGEQLGEAEQQPGAEAQPSRQVEAAEGDGLPFTGLAAIPLMVAGSGLLVTGFTLRRRTR